jgi:hypothetical protein
MAAVASIYHRRWSEDIQPGNSNFLGSGFKAWPLGRFSDNAQEEGACPSL